MNKETNNKIPYFVDIGINAPVEGKETVKRNNVSVIVEHPSKEKILLLDWKQFGWKSFIIGGIEDNETFEDSAIRETIEETGYNDFLDIKEIGGEIHSLFHARHKGVNRYCIGRFFYIKLKSLQQIGVLESETEFHDTLWVDKEEVNSVINIDGHTYAWNLFIQNKNFDEEVLNTLKTFKGYK